MFSRFIKVIVIITFLCLTGFEPLIWAIWASDETDIEAKLKQLEAKLIYESASQLASDEEYDKAIRRLTRIISEYPGTEYAQLAERKKEEIATLRIQPKPISGSSRASLVGFGTLFTTWLGVGTLILVEAEGPEPYGLALIAGPLGGLAISLNLTRNAQLSQGQASLINLGGAWGIWQATGAAIIADMDEKAVVGASMAGGLIGLALSTSVVKGREVSPGDATLINFGGIWGTWLGVCGAKLADKDIEYEYEEDDDDVLASALIGGDVGLLTMAALAPKLKMSRARARLINIGGIVGTLYGLGTNILLEIDPDFEGSAWGIMGLGSLLGLAAGAYFTKDYDSEKGYFAESSTSLLNIEPDRKQWHPPVPTVTISHPNNLNNGPARIPDLKLQLSLVDIKF